MTGEQEFELLSQAFRGQNGLSRFVNAEILPVVREIEGNKGLKIIKFTVSFKIETDNPDGGYEERVTMNNTGFMNVQYGILSKLFATTK